MVDSSLSPGISLIIVSYNSRHVLAPCLDSAIHAGGKIDVGFEIIIVDNNSRDGTIPLMTSRYSQLKWILSETNLGFGSACNRGAFSASYSLLIFMNPDTIVEENTFKVMLDLYAKQPDIGIAGCKILNPDKTLQLACKRSFPTPSVALYRLLGLSLIFPKSRIYGKYNLTYLDENQVHEVDAVSGSFLCIKKDLFDEISGFDEDFFMYGEDLDICYRVKLKGYRNYYTPDTGIIHFKGESAKSRPISSFIHFYSAMIIFSKKHFELRILPVFLLYSGAFIIALFNFFRNWGRKWQRWAMDLMLVNLILSMVTIFYSQYKGLDHIIVHDPVLYLKWHAILSLSVFFSIGYSGDYSKTPTPLRVSTVATGMAILVFFALGYFFYEEAYSRIVFGLAGVCSFVFLVSWRSLANKGSLLLGRLFASRERVIIIGANQRGLELRDLILEGYLPGFEFIGFVKDTKDIISDELRQDVVGDLPSITRVLRHLDLNQVIIALNEEAYQTAISVITQPWSHGLKVKILVGNPKPRMVTLVDLNYNR